MRDPQRRWRLGLLAGAVVALALLAGSLSELELGPGTQLPVAAFLEMLFPARTQSSSPEFVNLARILLLLIFWVVTPIMIIALIVWRDFRRSFLRSLPMYITFGLLLYLSLRFLRDMILANEGDATSVQQNSAPETPWGEPAAFPAAPSFVSNPPQWLIILVTLVLVTLIALLVWWLWPRGRGAATLTPLDRLTDEAQAALDDLRAGADVRDTVLRCYAEMSRVLREARGVQRGAGMTAREFAQQLRAAGLTDEHIERLTRLFERVRYGGEGTSARDAREAEACLFVLVQSYGKVFA